MKLLSKNKLVRQVLVWKVKEDPDGVDKICVGMSQNPIINFTDGTKVIFSWEEICNMAADFKKIEGYENDELDLELSLDDLDVILDCFELTAEKLEIADKDPEFVEKVKKLYGKIWNIYAIKQQGTKNIEAEE